MKNPPDTIIVMLRCPYKYKADERRSDPFWEFGSFGCTGCHRTNLLNPKRLDEVEGARLAFAQGGDGEIRLVFLTPPVRIKRHAGGAELLWSPANMPLMFKKAPLLIDNAGKTDVPAVLEAIGGTRRGTPVGQFSSRFRSRRQPVYRQFARPMEKAFDECAAAAQNRARDYVDALPYAPPSTDNSRQSTYERVLSELNQDQSAPSGRQPKRKSRNC